MGLPSVLRRLTGRVAAAAPRRRTRLPVERLYELSREPGRRLAGEEPVTIRHHDLGELDLPDGELIACDPFVGDGTPVDGAPVPGRHRVGLRIADYDGRDQRTAAAVLSLRAGEPVRWEPARTRDGRPYGLGVDSGTGCFASAAALAALQRRLEAEDPAHGIVGVDDVSEALGATYRDTWSWANAGGIVAFTTGLGDGWYPLFWGLDAAGERLCALVDMLVLDSAHDPREP